MPPQVTIAIPCFNEAARLAPDGFRPLLERADVGLLFVDDGSTDGTFAVLEGLCARWPGHAETLRLARNQGKAEAVRQGLRAGLARGAACVGYLDADLATPADEMARLIDVLLGTPAATAVIGSRVALLGAAVRRHPTRHYLGRVFATAASLILGVPVYDTQCGAKVFRGGPLLERALAEPFHSPWIFDVELLARVLAGAPDGVLEVPLRRWSDIPGSKLGARAMARAGVDLARLGAERLRRRPGR